MIFPDVSDQDARGLWTQHHIPMGGAPAPASQQRQMTTPSDKVRMYVDIFVQEIIDKLLLAVFSN